MRWECDDGCHIIIQGSNNEFRWIELIDNALIRVHVEHQVSVNEKSALRASLDDAKYRARPNI